MQHAVNTIDSSLIWNVKQYSNSTDPSPIKLREPSPRVIKHRGENSIAIKSQAAAVAQIVAANRHSIPIALNIVEILLAMDTATRGRAVSP